MKKQIRLLPSQKKFLFSDALHTAYIGGFGSGKSHVGIAKTIVKKLSYPGIPVAYYLPTYPLIKDIAFPKISEQLDHLGLRYELNKTDKEFKLKNASKIIMRSMDNPYSIIGYEVGYSCIDEVDVLPQEKMTEAYGKILARNRAILPDGDKNMTDVVGTPEGFKFAYNYFVKNANDNRVLIKARTKENPYLPPYYIETLEDTYTAEQLESYLDGEFVNLTSGNVYKNFNRSRNHSDRQLFPADVLHIGMDFNITNMNAVIHVIDETPIAVGEITGVYDTPAMIEKIRELPNVSVVIYPDASGKNRSTSGRSDIDLLRQAGFVIRTGNRNPFVRDRVNAMNKAFMDINGLCNYKVNTDNCPVYTEALEQQGYKNGEPDKQGGFDHITEAGGYFVMEHNKKRAKIY